MSDIADWTAEEIEILRTNYTLPRKKIQALLPGMRTIAAINYKLGFLGLMIGSKPAKCHHSNKFSTRKDGLCSSCYSLKRMKEKKVDSKMAPCHLDKLHYAYDMCKNCYHTAKRKGKLPAEARRLATKATCHPGRVHYGRGLCSPCYYTETHQGLYDRNRFNKYGMTREEGEVWFIAQDGKCAICAVEITLYSEQATEDLLVANIDHCHKTGKVRGFLCMNCNHGLGSFRDNIESLLCAAEYLERNK